MESNYLKGIRIALQTPVYATHQTWTLRNHPHFSMRPLFFNEQTLSFKWESIKGNIPILNGSPGTTLTFVPIPDAIRTRFFLLPFDSKVLFSVNLCSVKQHTRSLLRKSYINILKNKHPKHPLWRTSTIVLWIDQPTDWIVHEANILQMWKQEKHKMFTRLLPVFNIIKFVELHVFISNKKL